MALLVVLGHAVFAQTDSTKTAKKISYASLNLKNRPNDHFMIELSYDNWIGKTDSMNTQPKRIVPGARNLSTSMTSNHVGTFYRF